MEGYARAPAPPDGRPGFHVCPIPGWLICRTRGRRRLARRRGRSSLPVPDRDDPRSPPLIGPEESRRRYHTHQARRAALGGVFGGCSAAKWPGSRTHESLSITPRGGPSGRSGGSSASTRSWSATSSGGCGGEAPLTVPVPDRLSSPVQAEPWERSERGGGRKRSGAGSGTGVGRVERVLVPCFAVRGGNSPSRRL